LPPFLVIVVTTVTIIDDFAKKEVMHQDFRTIMMALAYIFINLKLVYFLLMFESTAKFIKVFESTFYELQIFFMIFLILLF